MENEVEPAVGAIAGIKQRPEDVAETKKEWVAPKLRKVEIAEITAAGANATPDAVTSS